MGDPLFIPQCIAGFHPGCCASRVNSEEDSDSNGETDSKKDRGTSYHCRRKSGNNEIRAKNADHNSQDASCDAQQRGFNKELDENIAFTGSKCLTYAYLTGSFRYGNEHDIHDTDTADQERETSDSRK